MACQSLQYIPFVVTITITNMLIWSISFVYHFFKGKRWLNFLSGRKQIVILVNTIDRKMLQNVQNIVILVHSCLKSQVESTELRVEHWNCYQVSPRNRQALTKSIASHT